MCTLNNAYISTRDCSMTWGWMDVPDNAMIWDLSKKHLHKYKSENMKILGTIRQVKAPFKNNCS